MTDDDMSRYDRDPDALAWARAKVRDIEKRYRRLAEAERLPELAARFRWTANLLSSELIGGDGCVIAAFDERRASLPPAPDGESP